MKIQLVAVGTLKEAFYRQASQEYLKRLRPMTRIEVAEIPEAGIETKGQEGLIRKALEKEGEAILKRINPDAWVCVLSPEGRTMDSSAFSQLLSPHQNPPIAELVFVIGGSHGLDPRVYDRAALKLSFGPMTFPHQLARVMLLEQIYRGMMILAGRPYHK